MPDEKNTDIQLALIGQELKAINTKLDEMKTVQTSVALHDQRITTCENSLRCLPNHTEMANDHIEKLSNHSSRIESCETSIKDLFNRFWAVVMLVIAGAVAYWYK